MAVTKASCIGALIFCLTASTVIPNLVLLLSSAPIVSSFLPRVEVGSFKNTRTITARNIHCIVRASNSVTETTESEAERNNLPKMISLTELLSSCVDAASLGCDVIRKYQLDGGISKKSELKEAGEVKSVVTQADIDAQEIIVKSLRRLWGKQLKIVGEEDDENDEDYNIDSEDTGEILRTKLLNHHLENAKDTKVPIEELTVFVDPLDGTREFVEGRLQNVGCLIGVARGGKAILGAVGLPFPKGENDEDYRSTAVHYAMSLSDDEADMYYGVYPSMDNSNDILEENESTTVTIFTGDSKDPVLQNATRRAIEIATAQSSSSQVNHVILGGTTSKLVAAAQQANSMAVLHFKTCLWDTCAPGALLQACGGKITDLFGSPLVHQVDEYSQTNKYGNILGVVVSSPGMSHIHDELCKDMREDEESVNKVLSTAMKKRDKERMEQQLLKHYNDDDSSQYAAWLIKRCNALLQE